MELVSAIAYPGLNLDHVVHLQQKEHLVKKFLLICLLASTAPARAEGLNELCASIGGIGGLIMTQRQDGALMSDVRIQY